MKLHTLALISAMALSGASISNAQMTQGGATGTTAGSTNGTSPTTPPMHPTESAKNKNCKNMATAEERTTCMQHNKKGHSGSKSKSGTGGTDASGVNNDANGSGTGYSRPQSKP